MGRGTRKCIHHTGNYFEEFQIGFVRATGHRPAAPDSRSPVVYTISSTPVVYTLLGFVDFSSHGHPHGILSYTATMSMHFHLATPKDAPKNPVGHPGVPLETPGGLFRPPHRGDSPRNTLWDTKRAPQGAPPTPL